VVGAYTLVGVGGLAADLLVVGEESYGGGWATTGGRTESRKPFGSAGAALLL
jgi:hypothetical protein